MTTELTLERAHHHTEEPAWRRAGAAWEHAATDWAFLFEPYARDAVEAVFRTAEVGPGTSLLDVACGSGLAVARAERMGASAAGIDAAEGLVEIARRRAPRSELLAGDMFALPWADDSFDVVTSFNGIWGGCDAAVLEMARVLRPGGMAAITFWGRSSELDLRDFFITIGTAAAAVGEELMDLAKIGHPGVAEAMFNAAGLDVTTRDTTSARFEWPDEDIAWRALRSPGVVAPSLAAVGEDELRARVLDAVAPFRSADGSYVLENELTHLIARLPG